MKSLYNIIQELKKYQKNLENTDFSNPDDIKDYITKLVDNLGHIADHVNTLERECL